MGKQGGFSLIELMIALVVIAILAAIGYPSYTEYVNRGKRAEGKAALMRAAQQLERFYSLNNCYPSGTANCANAASSSAALAAVSVNAFSGDSAAGSAYNLSVTTTPQAFTLTATPTFTDAKCGNLTLANTGAKGKTGTESMQNCWSK